MVQQRAIGLRMIDVESFKLLVGRKIKRFLIIVWPPLGENSILDVDMSIGFEFEDQNDSIVQISIDKDDNWTPILSNLESVNGFEWKFFESRLYGWMNEKIDDLMSQEIYDTNSVDCFNDISSSEVIDVEFLTIKGEFNPFGVKLSFYNDYIILTPTSDGSTFETSKFNQLGNIDNYNKIGEIEYVNLTSLC